ncbi:MAG: MFS transporter [Pirellulales bacterium]|nr:MFS transporter [Pirellulales bacterium]
MSVSELPPAEPNITAPPRVDQSARLRDLTATQWKSGAAAWLGWLFDGLDMHLYTLVATPFVAELLAVDRKDPAVGEHASWIQAAFLVGWALGGGFFGRLGDRLGRSRALVLTILTYALFTGLSYFAGAWWHLLIFRFLAALGIGGEWAVGAALLSETWPHNWRPWLAAVLQSAVNVGVMLASLSVLVLAGFPPRTVFLIGVLPALMVVWIRRHVPETEGWHAARSNSRDIHPGILDLFRGSVRRITWLTLLVCSFSLAGHWAFMFWCLQHLRNLPDVLSWTDAERSRLVSQAMILLMVASIAGNFLAAWVARRLGYRFSIVLLCIGYFFALLITFGTPRDLASTLAWMAVVGACSGVFALFTMYMPPLFPTLLRTTGAGFCYNIGRLAAAAGTVFFGLFSQVGDYRQAMLYAGFLFLPAAALGMLLPEHNQGELGAEVAD